MIANHIVQQEIQTKNSSTSRTLLYYQEQLLALIIPDEEHLQKDGFITITYASGSLFARSGWRGIVVLRNHLNTKNESGK